MKGSTKKSRAALAPEQPNHRDAIHTRRWTPQRLRRTGRYWRARILSTAAHFELFDWVGTGVKSPKAVSTYFGGTPQGWEIFLDALSAMGLLRKHGKRYENSRFSLRYLCAGKGSFLLPDHDTWDLWGMLPGLLTTGKRPKISQPFFSHPKRTERLLYALDQDARKIAPYLIKRLRLNRSKNFLDLGGGLGAFTLECCRRFPHFRATLVEHPSVVSLARRAVKNVHMEKRIHVIGLDILKASLPRGFDTVLVSNVLHGQGVRKNRALLNRVYRCLSPGGQCILRDVFMTPDRTDPEWGALFSVLLLFHTPDGRCYALDEVREWLRQAGFSKLEGPFRSSPLFFDPDSVLIAKKS